MNLKCPRCGNTEQADIVCQGESDTYVCFHCGFEAYVDDWTKDQTEDQT